MSIIVYESNDTLYHHGIKGQKWGVRRFQNKDGSLTNAGRKHTRSEKKEAKKQLKTLEDKLSEAGMYDSEAHYNYDVSPTKKNYQKWVKTTAKYNEIQDEVNRLIDEYHITSAADKTFNAAASAYVIGLAALPVAGLLASFYGSKH